MNNPEMNLKNLNSKLKTQTPKMNNLNKRQQGSFLQNSPKTACPNVAQCGSDSNCSIWLDGWWYYGGNILISLRDLEDSFGTPDVLQDLRAHTNRLIGIITEFDEDITERVCLRVEEMLPPLNSFKLAASKALAFPAFGSDLKPALQVAVQAAYQIAYQVEEWITHGTSESRDFELTLADTLHGYRGIGMEIDAPTDTQKSSSLHCLIDNLAAVAVEALAIPAVSLQHRREIFERVFGQYVWTLQGKGTELGLVKL